MKSQTSLTVFFSAGMLFATHCFTPASAQGTFHNLDFESAIIVPVVTNGMTFAEFGPAFPGWVGYLNSTPMPSTSLILFNSQRIGTPGFSLVDQSYPFGGISNYTALLQGGFPPEDGNLSLAQTGLVPVGSMSLRFYADRTFDSRPFDVRIDGQLLTPTAFQDFGRFREYSADISAFAGQTVELRFTQGNGQANFNDFWLDNISFSTTSVPEPSTWALLALGSALFWNAARRRRK